MEDYDLDKRIPKSLDCRHSICKSCLVRDGKPQKPLKRCPSCRQKINDPENAANDLTMIDYLERKRQKRRGREQKERKAKLRDLLKTVSQELRKTEADLDEQKKSSLELAEENMGVFAVHAKDAFRKALLQLTENEEVVCKMASKNNQELNDRMQLLQTLTALVTSLLEQPYVNDDDFDACGREIQMGMQQETSLLQDQSESLWNIYREFLLDQFLRASSVMPIKDSNDRQGIT